MQLGMIGLGRMGMNMVRRLLQGGHEIIVFNRTPEKVKEIEKEGAIASSSLAELVKKLEPPRIVWLMLPVGKVVHEHLLKLKDLLSEGDILIEGGNSNYQDDIKNADFLKDKNIHYIDAGVSGGIWGLKVGYCTMVGGDVEQFKHIEPILKTLSPPAGYMYCGSTGAGHYVKMIHNGIEYGLMEAYGEGFEILKASPYAETLDLQQVSHLWNQGSVVRSWLLELLEEAFSKDKELAEIQGYVEDSGEARFTVKEAIDNGVSAPVIAHSLFKRFQSRQGDAFSDKVVAALRNEFGGHAVAKKGETVKTKKAGAGKIQHAKSDKE
ncbi:MAG: decarboxylating 6-phosphogluconate dehydrogenase [Candidatus Theseobacter exili]|nr:decarboxylating 6-phosphogluconate dehydrogenase [Candidatus Theseobacter exili]